MAKDQRHLLAVLKTELEYLERGGYRRPTRNAWRPQFIFQDSPACPNFDQHQEPTQCSECLLMKLIPRDLADQKFPCRQIPLNERGQTVDWFYRYGTQQELESALRNWLEVTKQQLEKEKSEFTCSVKPLSSLAKAK